MADVALPHRPVIPTMNAMDYDRIDPNVPRASTLGRPPPNPPFVFPMPLQPVAPEPSSNRAPSSENTSTGPSKTRSRPQQLSISRLPDFKFQPSPETKEPLVPVTPSSPSKSRMIPSHQGGHRRNGSEFIGGDGKSALTGLMSTSPTKGDGILPPPPGARTGPPPGRRGHAHRRSGAVSSHDVSAIFKPANETRGGSAPSSPSDPFVQFSLVPNFDRSLSQPATTVSSMPVSPAAHHRQASSSAGPPRPRVGFSDRVEFIPRPLSTISSETSSSLSTIRPCHSVTGSISSIVSNGNTSSQNVKAAGSPARDTDDYELSLSPSPGPGSNDYSSRSRSSLVLSTGSPLPECRTPSDPLSWTHVFGSPLVDHELCIPNEYDHARSIPRLSGAPTASRTRRRPVSLHNPTLARPRSSPEPKVSKRQQKKVKTWAGSILARKARESMQEMQPSTQTSLSAPPSSAAVSNDLSLENLTFDEDTSYVIQTAPSPTHKPQSMKMDSPSPRVNASSLNPDTDVDESDLVLDLDAALGTLNPISAAPSFEDVTASRNQAGRRRLHSSGSMGYFDKTGMYYHRRAESAPEMAAIDRQDFSSRMVSNQAMADVFEEDEDELVEIAATDESKAEQAQGLGVAIVDDAHKIGSPSRPVSEQRAVTALNSMDGLQRDTADSTTPSVDQPALGTIDIVDADEEPRAPVTAKLPHEPGATSTSASEPFNIGRPASAPMLYTLPAPSPTLTAPEFHSTALSTPDFSQTSFEGPRLHTATSSITDRATLSSFRVGDHGFDTRGSVDDVPSLTSSASTMASAYPPRMSSSAPTRTSADKPPSLSSLPTVPRTRPGNGSKRSSLASLSRLVGGSSGERSKLNLTEYAQPEEKEKIEKKRGKRISRLMRWWKPKEKMRLS